MICIQCCVLCWILHEAALCVYVRECVCVCHWSWWEVGGHRKHARPSVTVTKWSVSCWNSSLPGRMCWHRFNSACHMTLWLSSVRERGGHGYRLSSSHSMLKYCIHAKWERVGDKAEEAPHSTNFNVSYCRSKHSYLYKALHALLIRKINSLKSLQTSNIINGPAADTMLLLCLLEPCTTYSRNDQKNT